MGRKDNTKKSSLVWKEVGVNPFTHSTAKGKGISSLGSSDFTVPKFREFKVEGSRAPTVNLTSAGALGEEQSLEISDDRIKQKEDELMGVDGGEDGMEIIPSLALARPPLMEIVNQESQIPSEHAVVRISSCSLKRIDPALRSGQRVRQKK